MNAHPLGSGTPPPEQPCRSSVLAGLLHGGIIISLVETEQRSDTGLIIQIALSTLEPRQPQLGVADEVRGSGADRLTD